ncbi:hypothetical protein C7T94_06740 [Pedobacter yulinensis]|uniref:Prokaryotic glutathione synthetase ATP-binding domain-containing protein n=1 Tax=Pedobacter yulinensis TaxID=2126353 RepID=A0A2T3HPP3_9SPHI|nr:hypothetical protein [Pedobacter yulinensis]PST84399.1 hypothetical protein C7T94_06740 [Pedobacter yulinensis]
MTPRTKLALITFRPPAGTVYDTLFSEDEHLAAVLHQKGFEVSRVAWDAEGADWTVFDLAFIRSPWDYHHRYTEFMEWLERMEKSGLPMFNPYAMLRWNSDKHYLQHIGSAGLPVIPSVFLEKGTSPDLAALFDRLGCEKLIIKPCVSGGARNTRVLERPTVHTTSGEINSWLRAESYLVQPFMEEVKEGEWSFLFFNGQFSHSVLKVPKSGDFRVQHTHGGSILRPDPAPEHLEQAAAYVQAFAAGSLYARVDAIATTSGLQLMELELIEPYLFLENASGSAEAFADALTVLLSTTR